MRKYIRIELPGLPPSLNGSHGHWRAKAKEKAQWRSLACTIAKPFRFTQPLTSVHLRAVRYSPRAMDYDNLVASFKNIIDGLRDAGIIWNDDPKTIVKREYKWAKAKLGQGFVEITVSGTLASEEFLKAEEEKRMQRELKKAKALLRKRLKKEK